MFTIILHNVCDFSVRHYAEHQTFAQVSEKLKSMCTHAKMEILKDPRKIEHLIYIDGVWVGSVRDEGDNKSKK